MAQTTFAVTQDNQVIWLDSDGNQEAVSPKDFALSVTCDIEGTIWIVSTDYGPNGNVIKYYQGFPNQSKWVSLDASLGAIQVVGRSQGRCVFLAPDGSVHLADTSGGHSQITKLGTASSVAALGDFPIYILTNTVVKGSGNVIESTDDEGQTWKVVPNGDAAQATQIFVQIYNNVVFLNQDGAAGFLDGTQNNQVRLVSPPNLALALGISGANFWWVVSTDVDPQTGGNLLKYWDGGGTDGSNWKTTTPPIPGVAVGPR